MFKLVCQGLDPEGKTLVEQTIRGGKNNKTAREMGDLVREYSTVFCSSYLVERMFAMTSVPARRDAELSLTDVRGLMSNQVLGSRQWNKNIYKLGRKEMSENGKMRRVLNIWNGHVKPVVTFELRHP